MNAILTGKPSVDKPWMKYYPDILMQMIKMPKCTILQYLKDHCPGMEVAAIDYYGTEVKWAEIFDETEKVARSLRAMGFKEGDQIPAFLRLVPEFVPLLLGAEKIGASILCRDNTVEENVEAASKAGAKAIFAHDFLSQMELEAFREGGVEKVVVLDPMRHSKREELPSYIADCLNSFYPDVTASKGETMSWDAFLELGESYIGQVEATEDITRPLYRCYTSGSTGPSKQVIHSAETMLDIICQMNFYGGAEGFRPNWMVSALPPALVAVVVAMMLLPMASNKLLIMNPFVRPEDIDLEFMRIRPNNLPLIPYFTDVIVNSKRIPADYDASHFLAGGAGSEAINNQQLRHAQNWFNEHGCKFRFTTGYGCSEAGSNVSLPMAPKPLGNGNVGIPMPLSVMSIFKPGTHEELGYNQIGEICKCGPGTMLGYDNPEATAKALQTHEDGSVWLHTGDMGYIDEDGVFYTVGRGGAPRFSGGFCDIQVMENLIADADIEGIKDEFYVNIPDDEHPGYFLPYLYVVLKEGFTVADVEEKILSVLKPEMFPVEIIPLEKRPFWHFKTNRIGLSKDLQVKRAYEKQENK